ncbi:MAG TPA: GNAT family N-acetyltransferase [Thermomicrobiales bacterium]|nr:GNAT family N-acetyltransferase [Thermomicrobiales bacterium]
MGVSESFLSQLPEGYMTRAPTLDDVEAVVALERACVAAGVSTGPSSAVDLRRHWEDPHRQDGDEDTLVIAPDGRVVGYLEYFQAEPFTDFEFEAYVHPEHAVIAGALLEAVEAKARHSAHLAPDGERVVLLGYTVSTSQDMQRLLSTRGFAHHRDGLTMEIELTEQPPQPVWPPGVAVRRFVPGQDERAVWETLEASWQDQYGYSPMSFEEFVYYRITAQTDFDASLWLLAVDGEAVVGILLGLPGSKGIADTGRISVVGVLREHRKRGIGLALMYESFNEFWQRKYSKVNLGVDASSLTGADRLYERAGMREVGRTVSYEKVLRE